MVLLQQESPKNVQKCYALFFAHVVELLAVIVYKDKNVLIFFFPSCVIQKKELTLPPKTKESEDAEQFVNL